ncbi:hypothetical protein [Methanonatronarchaeum sp. AMET-Sl]|uniref:hypothetical protein n=1 Tax=Methanonatronarchaeum sp. AMET-Sl TaxID=3037654 RepID=UPI00244E3F44|nr:hypothetical protein [Methanonatronarchaeum sp. AMET-Sl]WGI16930.1 hypothetical protein QEN48_05370 [Methanonatronarchaeum sp. AMET-Sl]
MRKFVFNDDLQRKGISRSMMESKHDNLKCPECANVFNLFYSRAFACKGCPHAIDGCEFVRCPKCDTEFLLEKHRNKMESKALDNYMSSIINQYLKDFGDSPKR